MQKLAQHTNHLSFDWKIWNKESKYLENILPAKRLEAIIPAFFAKDNRTNMLNIESYKLFLSSFQSSNLLIPLT